MNWLFWALLIVALLLLLMPLGFVLSFALEAALWILGAVLLIVAIIWAVNLLSKPAHTNLPPA